MKISVLASGSKSNCSYLEISNKKILIDFGTSVKYTKEKLAELNVDLKDINYIFITHSHGDHTSGLETYIKKYNGKVFLTEKIYNELGIKLPNYELLIEKKQFDNFNVEFIKLSHDTEETIGYIFQEGSKTLTYITDTGYVNQKYFKKISNSDCYVIESNHDVEMLMKSRYQYYTKIRIVGDKGHLSNEKTSEIIDTVMGNKTKNIILIHLSEENNDPLLAKETIKKRIKKGTNIYVSEQHQRTELIEI